MKVPCFLKEKVEFERELPFICQPKEPCSKQMSLDTLTYAPDSGMPKPSRTKSSEPRTALYTCVA